MLATIVPPSLRSVSYTHLDMMICTSGSQQIADCLAKVVCNEGDTVLTEDPSFLGVLDSIRSNGANLVGVKMEDDGIDLSDLEEKLQIKPTPKFIYVIPVSYTHLLFANIKKVLVQEN